MIPELTVVKAHHDDVEVSRQRRVLQSVINEHQTDGRVAQQSLS